MAEEFTVEIPDIGDFAEVEVIEVHVAAGDTVAPEDPLITLESDKATMDVPAPRAGTVQSVAVAVGERVSQGSAVCVLGVEAGAGDADADDDDGAGDADEGAADGAGAGGDDGTGADAAGGDAPAPSRTRAGGDGDADIDTEVLVLGAGPGGYTAAFRSADLGKRTVLVERYAALGGVCLNVGCIPSKALLHTAELISGARAMAAHGVDFGEPSIDLDRLREYKDGVIGKLTKGLTGLARQRKVEVVRGTGQFTSPHTLIVDTDEGARTIRFEHAIIAAGSQATAMPAFPNDDPRLMDSTGALDLADVPARLLVVGGGIIGLEMATVYAALGSKVSVVELLDGLMPGCDRDLVRVLQKRIERQYEHIWTGTRVTSITPAEGGLEVTFEGDEAPERDLFDRVLVAVGRRPNGPRIGAEHAGVKVDDAGFIPVDRQCRTNIGHIFAIGDIVGQPMLAHKATHEGKVAAEVIAGHKASFDALTIPSVAYTDPEVAWMGPTEIELKAAGTDYDKAVFPWAASGRALGIGREEGMTKVLFDPESHRIIGAGIVGVHAGDLIAEAVLALEMGADAQDIGLTIHPHPTLSETFNFAAEMHEGTITDLYVPKGKPKRGS